MNIKSTENVDRSGFTLIEILIAIAIAAILLSVGFISLKSAKNRASDAETKKIISEIALNAEEQEIAPGVVDYEKAFSSISAEDSINTLATKLKLDSSQYEYSITPKEYAIVFPLKKGTFYCIDSFGRANGKEVTGLFASTGEKKCDNATRVVYTGGGSSSIPDLSASLSPTTLDMSAQDAVGNINIVIREIADNPTIAPVNVRIFKQSGFSYSTNTSGWTKSSEDSLRATFTMNNIIPASGSAQLTITITRSPVFFNHGTSNANVQLLLGSGGDVTPNNNGPVPGSVFVTY